LKLNNTLLVKHNGQYIKCEFQQPSGCHKDRETKWILDNIKGFSEYCITTSGNAGISLARAFKTKATIFCPASTHWEKIELIHKYGGTVIFGGATYETAFGLCEGYIAVSPGTRVNVSTGKVDKFRAYKDLAWELEDLHFEHIFVPSGTLTLAGGLATYFSGTVHACVLPSNVSKQHSDIFSSVSVNFQDWKLVDSVNNVVVHVADPKALDLLLYARTLDTFLSRLDPCVMLPLVECSAAEKKNSVVIATGVAR
jgi:threonine dehydratase